VLANNGEIKEFTAEGVMNALNKAKSLDMGGVIPPWTPTAKGPEGQTRVSNPDYYIAKYKNSGEDETLTKKPVSLEEAMKGEF
jgi:hypothetical protein